MILKILFKIFFLRVQNKSVMSTSTLNHLNVILPIKRQLVLFLFVYLLVNNFAISFKEQSNSLITIIKYQTLNI